jgi:hypothetical protein
MGTEIRFRLYRGSAVSKDAHLLVNKPKVTINGESFLNFESDTTEE